VSPQITAGVGSPPHARAAGAENVAERWSCAVAVLAKQPLPGRVKTRLTPPYSPEQAAQLAGAALADTLDAVAGAGTGTSWLVLDGDAGGWQRPGFQIVPQRGQGLDERLGHALVDVADASGLSVLLVGMDTPQLRSERIVAAVAALRRSDAVLGPATDGGFWAIGLNDPRPEHCLGVQMSRPDTGRRQLERLQRFGLDVCLLEQMTDVDDMASAQQVATAAPATRFARLLAAMSEAAHVTPNARHGDNVNGVFCGAPA